MRREVPGPRCRAKPPRSPAVTRSTARGTSAPCEGRTTTLIRRPARPAPAALVSLPRGAPGRRTGRSARRPCRGRRASGRTGASSPAGPLPRSRRPVHRRPCRRLPPCRPSRLCRPWHRRPCRLRGGRRRHVDRHLGAVAAQRRRRRVARRVACLGAEDPGPGRQVRRRRHQRRPPRVVAVELGRQVGEVLGFGAAVGDRAARRPRERVDDVGDELRRRRSVLIAFLALEGDRRGRRVEAESGPRRSCRGSRCPPRRRARPRPSNRRRRGPGAGDLRDARAGIPVGVARVVPPGPSSRRSRSGSPPPGRDRSIRP